MHLSQPQILVHKSQQPHALSKPPCVENRIVE